MGLFSRNKFKKIKREDIVDAICRLEKEQTTLMEQLDSYQEKVGALYAKGKAETDRNVQLFYAKKIEAMQREKTATAKRLQYLNANINAFYKLKTAFDDKDFLENSTNVPLNDLLKDQKELQKFLTSVNMKKMSQESGLESAFETFDLADDAYEESAVIYGSNEEVDNILSIFETAKGTEIENAFFDTTPPVEEAAERKSERPDGE